MCGDRFISCNGAGVKIFRSNDNKSIRIRLARSLASDVFSCSPDLYRGFFYVAGIGKSIQLMLRRTLVRW